MPALYGLFVKNFGILRDAGVEQLGGVNVLVGPNASGKSTLLRVIGFLGEVVRRDLVPALDAYGGMARLRTRDGKTSPIELRISAMVTSHAHEEALDEYQLSFHTQTARSLDGDVPAVIVRREESFKFKRTPQQGRRITIRGGRYQVVDERPKQGDVKGPSRALDTQSVGLSTLPRLGAGEGAEEVKKIADLFSTFRVFEIDVRRARQPSDQRAASPLRANASNLAAFLAFLKQKHSDIFDRIVNDARAMAPGLDDVHLRAVGGPSESVAVELEERGLKGRTPLADASFGTVRALALLAMLHDPNPPLLTCVEEIDHCLHPYVFDRLVDLLREASARTQFLVATHSPPLVNRLRPNEIIVCERDRETGLARVPAISQEEVAAIVAKAGDAGPGELWFSGSLGGVP